MVGHALRCRVTPLSVDFFETPDMLEHVLAMRELMRTAHARSGVPLWAAGQIALTLHQQHDAAALRGALAACADAVPQLLAMLQASGDAAEEEPSAAANDSDDNDDSDDVDLCDGVRPRSRAPAAN